VTFYESVEQLPPFRDYSMANRTYRYFREEPLYPFGYGLSYTTFRYEHARADSPEGDADGNILVSARVTNAGSVAGEEVVQVYVTHPDVEGAPIHALAGFTRISLAPGASQTVRFSLHERDLSIVDAEGIRRIIPRPVKAWIGGGQPAQATGNRQQATATGEATGHRPQATGKEITPGVETEFTMTRKAVLPE